MTSVIDFNKLTRNSIPWERARIVTIDGIVYEDWPCVNPVLTVCGNVEFHQTGHLLDWRSSAAFHGRREKGT